MSSILTIVKYKASIANERLKLMSQDKKEAATHPPLNLKYSNSTKDILRIYVKPVHLYWSSILFVLTIFAILSWSQYIQVNVVPQSTLSIVHNGNRPNTYVSSIYAPQLLEKDPTASSLSHSYDTSTSSDASYAMDSLSDACINQVYDAVNEKSLSPSSAAMHTSVSPAHSSHSLDDKKLVVQHFLQALARSIIGIPRNFILSLVSFVRFFVG